MTIRADHVGSLLRPPELLAARAAFAEGSLPLERLHEAEDLAIRAALAKQRDIGLDVVTDGEMRRGSWLTGMADSVEGFVPVKLVVDWKGPGGGTEGSTANAAGARLKKVRKLTGAELPLLKSEAGAPYKITLPAPSNFMLTSFRAGVTDKFYADRAELLADLVAIVRDDVEWLLAEGVRYIQFDAPYYSYYLDPRMREEARAAGLDPDLELEKGIAGDNAVLSGLNREGVTIALHICRGNSRSRWFTEGGYDAIAEKLFGLLKVDRFLLEYDNERAGGFEPLRAVPPGKSVVLGLVTTKEPIFESQDDLLRRIDQAAAHLPLDRLSLSPQCGFASVAKGNLMTVDDQWRKLELVVETARKAWA